MSKSVKKIEVKPELKIVRVAGAENPIRPDTAAHKRVQAVLSAKRVELALGRGARTSTVRFAVRAGLIRLVA